MKSTLPVFKRALDVFEENNAILRRILHEEEEEKKTEKQSRRWKLSEDLKLRQHVAVFGPRKWEHIGKKIKGRTGKTCRSRWANHLDPRISQENFSAEESKKILQAHIELGSQWSLIAKRFHGRTDRAVMNHLNRLKTKMLKKQSTSSMEAVEAVEGRSSMEAVEARSSMEAVEGRSSMEAVEAVEARTKFIDFLGVGDS